jgi:hypothetical protein
LVNLSPVLDPNRPIHLRPGLGPNIGLVLDMPRGSIVEELEPGVPDDALPPAVERVAAPPPLRMPPDGEGTVPPPPRRSMAELLLPPDSGLRRRSLDGWDLLPGEQGSVPQGFVTRFNAFWRLIKSRLAFV